MADVQKYCSTEETYIPFFKSFINRLKSGKVSLDTETGLGEFIRVTTLFLDNLGKYEIKKPLEKIVDIIRREDDSDYLRVMMLWFLKLVSDKFFSDMSFASKILGREDSIMILDDFFQKDVVGCLHRSAKLTKPDSLAAKAILLHYLMADKEEYLENKKKMQKFYFAVRKRGVNNEEITEFLIKHIIEKNLDDIIGDCTSFGFSAMIDLNLNVFIQHTDKILSCPYEVCSAELKLRITDTFMNSLIGALQKRGVEEHTCCKYVGKFLRVLRNCKESGTLVLFSAESALSCIEHNFPGFKIEEPVATIATPTSAYNSESCTTTEVRESKMDQMSNIDAREERKRLKDLYGKCEGVNSDIFANLYASQVEKPSEGKSGRVLRG